MSLAKANVSSAKLKAGTLAAAGRAAGRTGAWAHAAVTRTSATTAIRLMTFHPNCRPRPRQGIRRVVLSSVGPRMTRALATLYRLAYPAQPGAPQQRRRARARELQRLRDPRPRPLPRGGPRPAPPGAVDRQRGRRVGGGLRDAGARARGLRRPGGVQRLLAQHQARLRLVHTPAPAARDAPGGAGGFHPSP